MDKYLEAIVAQLTRIADALESGCLGLPAGDAGKGKPGRPKKAVTVDPVPASESAPAANVAAQTAAQPTQAATVVASVAPAAVVATPAVVVPASAAASVATVASAGTSVHPLAELQKLVGYVCGKGQSAGVKGIFAKYGVEKASAISDAQRDAAFEEIKALIPVETDLAA